MTEYTEYVETPAGILKIVSFGKMLSSVIFCDEAGASKPDSLTRETVRQLQIYFSGEPIRFSLPLDFSRGTPFQVRVWQALGAVPYGQTVSYSALASAVGTKAVRAVGSAVRKNPFVILLPCHRILPKSGTLGNYAYGADRKAVLLRLEKAVFRVD